MTREGLECSTAWLPLSAYGTASRAGFWVAVEQPGPWGREALTQSRLDPGLGERLGESALAAGGRVLLIRAPGHHAATDAFQSRRVLVAAAIGGDSWLAEGVVLDPADLEHLPWDALGAGDLDAVLTACPWLRPARRPVLLVCTNARRDVCCALKGRPIALDAAAEYPGQVWECSHTGGHRFAPTGIVLPLGQTLARLSPALAAQVLDAAASGRYAPAALGERHDRGRTHLAPALAAAESWVRALTAETDPDALRTDEVGEGDGEARMVVTHADGRRWDVVVTERVGDDLPDSCGKVPKPSHTFAVAAVPSPGSQAPGRSRASSASMPPEV